jgi:stage V sporulation protein AB
LMMIVSILFILIFGLAGGLIVGCGYVAFLTVLGLIPRLTQLSKTTHLIHSYEGAIIMGTLAGTWGALYDIKLFLPSFLLVPIGLACGIFVGMIAAALTEVVNVIPILTKRIGMEGQLIVVLMAIVIGKVIGSLFDWIYFVDQ